MIRKDVQKDKSGHTKIKYTITGFEAIIASIIIGVLLYGILISFTGFTAIIVSIIIGVLLYGILISFTGFTAIFAAIIISASIIRVLFFNGLVWLCSEKYSLLTIILVFVLLKTWRKEK